MRARSRASWRTEGAGHTGVHQGAAPLASLILSDPRGAHGPVLSRKVVTTDACLTGWGGIHEGRSVRGRWDVDLQRSHINFLELSAVFLPSLMGYHVLVRMDNTTTVAYINRQGGLRSRQLHMLACKLILWSCGRLLSLRATHVPGVLNTGADLLSRGAPVYGEWTLHPEIVEQI